MFIVFNGKLRDMPPSYPFIVVSPLTHPVIEEAIKAYIEEKADVYWLKLYYIGGRLTIEELNSLLNRITTS
jgi:hypothetical protein